MKLKSLFILSASVLLMAGCNQQGEQSSTTVPGPTSTPTSQEQPGNPFTVEAGEYISNSAENCTFIFDSSNKLAVNVYDSFGGKIKEKPNSKNSVADVTYKFVKADAYDVFNIYDSSVMNFTVASKDYSLFYQKTAEGAKGGLYLAAVTKKDSGYSYTVHPFVLYKNSAVYPLAANAVKANGNSIYYRSHDKTKLAMNNLHGGSDYVDAYIEIHFDYSVNYFYIYYSENGKFSGSENVKQFNAFSIKQFNAIYAFDKQTFSPGVVRMHSWNEETSSYKFVIEQNDGLWGIEEIEVFKQ